MRILIDTHVLVWAIGEPARLTTRARNALLAPGAQLLVSSVTAFEYADLHARGRLARAASLEAVIAALEVQVLDLPSDVWRLAAALPHLHGDPVDRMVIAHAIQADLTLITADSTVRNYPVSCLW